MPKFSAPFSLLVTCFLIAGVTLCVLVRNSCNRANGINPLCLPSESSSTLNRLKARVFSIFGKKIEPLENFSTFEIEPSISKTILRHLVRLSDGTLMLYVDFYNVKPDDYQCWFLPLQEQIIKSLSSVHIKGFLFDDISIDGFSTFIRCNPTVKSLIIEECNLNESFIRNLNLSSIESFELIGGTCNGKVLKGLQNVLSSSLRTLKIHCDFFDSVQSREYVTLAKFKQLQCLSLLTIYFKSVDFFFMLYSIESENLSELRISNCKVTASDIPLEKLSLSNLKILDLSRNNFQEGDLPFIFRNINSILLLEELNLEYCNIKELSQFEFITHDKFPYLKHLFIIQKSLLGNRCRDSSFSLQRINLNSISIGIDRVSCPATTSLYGIQDMENLQHINAKTSTIYVGPFTIRQKWRLNSSNFQHLEIDSEFLNSLVDFNLNSFKNLKSLSIQNHHVDSKLLNLIEIAHSSSNLCSLTIKITESLTNNLEKYICLGELIGSIKTLKRLDINLSILKDFYKAILAGKCTETIEYLRIVVNEGFLNFSVKSFFLTLTKFSNLKSLSVKITETSSTETGAMHELMPSMISRTACFPKLQKFHLNLKQTRCKNISNLNNVLRLMPKLNSFYIDIGHYGTNWRIFDFEKNLPIRFVCITVKDNNGLFGTIFPDKMYFFPFLASITMQIEKGTGLSANENDIFLAHIIKEIETINKSKNFTSPMLDYNGFLINVLLNSEQSKSMLAQRSSKFKNEITCFFISEQRYEILRCICENEWYCLSEDLIDKMNSRTFSWRKFCLAIECCQRLGYSLEALSSYFNTSDLNIIGHILLNNTLDLDSIDEEGLEYFFCDSVSENSSVNFMEPIIAKYMLKCNIELLPKVFAENSSFDYISPEKLIRKIDHLLWTFFSKESPICYHDIILDEKTLCHFLDLYELLFGKNMDKLIDFLKNNTLPKEITPMINSACGKPYNETKNFKKITEMQTKNILILLNSKIPIEGEFTKDSNIFVRLQRLFNDEQILEVLECVICKDEDSNDKFVFLPFKNEDDSIKFCHGFHVTCILMWLQDNQNCPMCRRIISENYKNYLE